MFHDLKTGRSYSMRNEPSRGSLEAQKKKNYRENIIAAFVGVTFMAGMTALILWIGREDREIKKNLNTDAVPPQMAVPPPDKDKKKKKAK